MKKHGFLYLRITVNPRGFHLISTMKFDESKDETQKHDDAKSTHYTTSFQCRQRSFETPSAELNQIEKMNKRIMMMTMSIPPPSFASFIDLLDNSHRTNNVIKLPITSFLLRKVEYQKEINSRQNPSCDRFNLSAHLFRVFPTSSDQKPQNQ